MKGPPNPRQSRSRSAVERRAGWLAPDRDCPCAARAPRMDERARRRHGGQALASTLVETTIESMYPMVPQRKPRKDLPT